MLFTKEEMMEIKEALSALMLDGFADNDDHPIVTAFLKAENALHSYD